MRLKPNAGSRRDCAFACQGGVNVAGATLIDQSSDTPYSSCALVKVLTRLGIHGRTFHLFQKPKGEIDRLFRATVPVWQLSRLSPAGLRLWVVLRILSTVRALHKGREHSAVHGNAQHTLSNSLQMLDHPFDYILYSQFANLPQGLKNPITPDGTTQEVRHLQLGVQILLQRF
jgi:hypothetical protein